MMRRRFPLSVPLLLLALFAVALPSTAGQDPNVRRGIAPGNAYRSFDIDTINQFSGSLVLRIPLTDAPVGPFLNQRLQLTYNSAIYDYQFVEHQNFPTDSIYKRRAIPETFSNSGLGWTLSLGRLVAPRAGTPTTPDRGWHYRSSSGAEHDFTLGVGDVSTAVTHDGSFLRLRRYPSSLSQVAEYREIDMPDGTVHRFNTSGDLTQIRDRVGHTIDIDYSDATKWVIRNKYSGTTFRTMTVHFETRTSPDPQYTYAPNFQKVVASIEVPAFNGAAAIYDLTYEDTLLQRDGCGDYLNFDEQKFAAPLLKEIVFPEGGKYEFSYTTGTAEACTYGLVKSAKLPTMGTIEWTHQPYRLSQKECDDEHGWVVETPGVETRILKNAAGTKVGEWTYKTAIDLNPGTDVACGAMDGRNFPYGPAPTEITTTVRAFETQGSRLTAVGGHTVSYFSGVLNAARAAALGYKTEEYGLPFTRRRNHSSNTARFLSTQRFDGSNGLRSTYLTYEGDAQLFDDKLANARVRGELTVFEGDTGCGTDPCRVDVDRPSDQYDQYGRYRKSTTTSNFAPSRTEFIDYTPDITSWIFGKYGSVWVEEGDQVRKQLVTFDGNGVLRTRRTLVNSGTSAASIPIDAKKDLLEVYCRTSRGYLSSERFFGGDGASASIPADPTDPCNVNPSATEYQIDHVTTFNASGAPTGRTAKYRGMPFFILDEDLDASTAAVSASRDVSGVSTTFAYDSIGRLKEEKPTGAPWTSYEYGDASGTTVPASVRITTRAAGTAATADPITDAYAFYDWMGRAVQQKQKLPSSAGADQWSATKITYDLFSRPTNVSVPEFRSAGSYESEFVEAHSTKTTYDVLGRPTEVIAPDGKKRTVTYAGNGVRSVSTKVGVALASGAADVTTVAHYDAYGRLLQIEEANNTRTRYSYGLSGRLSSVCQNTTDDGVTCGQLRTFDRDNRGFLTSETHVENGIVTYTYDARGNVLSKNLSGDAQSEGNLLFDYDAAERLLAVQTHHPTSNSYRPGKTFTFGAANQGTASANKTLGKLITATRYNYHGGELTVKESYDYEDPAGRLTKTTTEIRESGSLLQTLTQNQTYQNAGRVGTLQYPTCIAVACGAASWNVATFGYRQGSLTSVTGFANSISYGASGAVAEVKHANLVGDTYTADATGSRPKSIEFSGYSTCAEPSIANGSPGDQPVLPGGSATLTVAAAGATGYQWYEGNGTKLTGQTGVSFTTPPLNDARTYYVEVYNDCKVVRSRTATVNACSQLWVDGETPQNRSVAPEESVTLTVSSSGATSFQWYEDGAAVPGQTSSSFTTGPLTGSKTYYVVVSNACQTVTSRTATVTVRPLSAPAALVATANGTSSVTISWGSSQDAHHYVLERKAEGSSFVAVQSVSGTSVTTSAAVPNRSYVYRVRAVSASEVVSSPPSNVELATTMVFTPLVAGQTLIASSHFEELISAVNAVRWANGSAAATWASLLPAGVPAPAPGVAIRRQHILSLRSAMDAARAALGLAPLSYADATLAVPKVGHLLEIRGGVE